MKFTKDKIIEIELFLLEQIKLNKKFLIKETCNHFNISRPTVNKYLNNLVEANIIEKKSNNYKLKDTIHVKEYEIKKDLDENIIFDGFIQPLLNDNKKANIKAIIEYISSEILNNAIEHSSGSIIKVKVCENFFSTKIIIKDNGIGIFNKIKNDLHLQNPNQSILELYKGKFTSDPENHSGEGIFFASKMADAFLIDSFGLHFLPTTSPDLPPILFDDACYFNGREYIKGTEVIFEVNNFSDRKAEDIFNKYTDEENYGFSKTLIPLKIMAFEKGTLLSRSQGRRLMSRIENFENVILDFEDVNMIGQAFADEVFRVYQNKHPRLKISVINSNENIDKLIAHVKATKI